jgi:hypothetical protein
MSRARGTMTLWSALQAGGAVVSGSSAACQLIVFSKTARVYRLLAICKEQEAILNRIFTIRDSPVALGVRLSLY